MIRRIRNPESRIKVLEGRLQQYPSSAVFFPLASLLWEKGLADQAENLLKSGLATYPNYAAAGVLLGEILITKEEHEQAARYITKALEIAPWNISGRRLLAECYRKEGDEEATQVALRAVKMLEDDEVATQSATIDSNVNSVPVVVPEGKLDEVATPALAELYMAQGHLDKARDVYERLLKSDPDKVEWNERLAAIKEQISQEEDVDAPAGYPEMRENLDLLAGEVKGEADVPGKAKTADVTPEDMEKNDSDAETSSAEFQDSGVASSPTDKVSEVDKEGQESSVTSREEDVIDEKVVDSILYKMIELYAQEENNAHALDMCRKAQALGLSTPWILEKISVLEQKVEDSAASLLRYEEDKDRSTPTLLRADQIVVETMEGWLETLQRRKANT
ncbi:MAG: tetratricopeptide repeat protein [Nitrospinae bacterium]|nr:tetratricopeptide repeat protein [Nitrospinota bacterium]